MLTVKTEGLNRVRKRFSKIEQRGKNPEKAMNLIGAKAWKEVVQNNFANEKNEDGKRWKPLKYRKGKPLRDTSRLWNSIKWKASKFQAKVYTIIGYAKYHQNGEGRMKREFMFVSKKSMDGFTKTLLNYIKG